MVGSIPTNAQSRTQSSYRVTRSATISVDQIPTWNSTHRHFTCAATKRPRRKHLLHPHSKWTPEETDLLLKKRACHNQDCRPVDANAWVQNKKKNHTADGRRGSVIQDVKLRGYWYEERTHTHAQTNPRVGKRSHERLIQPERELEFSSGVRRTDKRMRHADKRVHQLPCWYTVCFFGSTHLEQHARYRGVGMQRCSGAAVEGCRGVEVWRCGGVEGCRGAEVKRLRGLEVL